MCVPEITDTTMIFHVSQNLYPRISISLRQNQNMPINHYPDGLPNRANVTNTKCSYLTNLAYLNVTVLKVLVIWNEQTQA